MNSPIIYIITKRATDIFPCYFGQDNLSIFLQKYEFSSKNNIRVL